MTQTLLLNASWEPICTIGWKRAISLMVTDKVHVLERYCKRQVHSSTRAYPIPAVVRLVVRVPYRRHQIRFSRRHVYARDDHTCQYCGGRFSLEDLTFDHVVPRARGGGKTWKNIVTCCFKCNQKKANRTPREAGMELLNEPAKPNWERIRAPDKDDEARSLWKPYLF